MKWVASLVGIILVLSLVNSTFAQEVFQPYNDHRNSPTYGPGGQAYRPYSSPMDSRTVYGPGIQIYQSFNKPWNSTPFGDREEGKDQYNNPWNATIISPYRR